MRLSQFLNFLAILATFALGGCGSAKYQDLNSALPRPPAGQARLVFLRNSSFVDANSRPGILLDGVVVGTSEPGKFFYIDTLIGPHTVATSSDANGGIDFDLADGDTQYVKTGAGFGAHAGRVVPELVNPERARSELAELEYGAAITSRSLTNARQAPAPAPLHAAPAVAKEPEPTTEVIPVPSLSASEPVVQAPPAVPAPLQQEQQIAPATPPAPTSPAPAMEATSDSAGQIHLGKSSTTVETLMNNEQNCVAVHGAELLSSEGPVEFYREQCRDGRIFMVRCEFRQCSLAGQQR